MEGLCNELGLESSVRVGDPIYGEEKGVSSNRPVGSSNTSRWEGSSIAVAEAILIGVPTLVTHFPMGQFPASPGNAILAELRPPAIRDHIVRPLRRGQGNSKAALSSHAHVVWEALARSGMDRVTAYG